MQDYSTPHLDLDYELFNSAFRFCYSLSVMLPSNDLITKNVYTEILIEKKS
jgi:hypothetical protein